MDWRLKDLWHSLKAAARLAPRAIAGQPVMALTYLLLKHSGLDSFEDYELEPPPVGARLVQKHSLASLTYLDPAIDPPLAPDVNLVLVLVEKRLLNEQPTALKGPQGDAGRSRDLGHGETAVSACAQPPAANANWDLRPALATLRQDIYDTPDDFGWQPNTRPKLAASVIVADVYAGNRHQDGRTVLALRRFFQDVQGSYPNLRGVILIGAFPDALLVRRTGSVGKSTEVVYAFRSDLVLADLDGQWDSLYCGEPDWHAKHRPRWALQKGGAVPKVADCFLLDDAESEVHVWRSNGDNRNEDFEVGTDDATGLGVDANTGKRRMRTLLHRIPLASAKTVYGAQGQVLAKGSIKVVDGRYTSAQSGADLGDLRNQWQQTLNELGIANLENPIALPEILISRLNARHVARSLGQGDDDHRWQVDPYLERALLLDYLDRNHRFRSGLLQTRACGGMACNHAGAAVWTPVDLRAAFAEIDCALGDIAHEKKVGWQGWKDCGLTEFAKWLDYPASLRSMLLHGEFGELILRNCRIGFRDLRPRWSGAGSQDHAAFYWNTSCYGYAPMYADKHPYNAHLYGFGTPAEMLLFFGEGLAIISRAHKGDDHPGKHPCDDNPPGGAFDRTLYHGRSYGETWRAMFEQDRGNDTLLKPEHADVRKAAYRWGIAGDWTLRLNR